MSTDASTVTLYPYVLCRDADAVMDWLERALGLARGDVHRDAAGTVQHAEMRLGSALVMLGTAGAGGGPFRDLRAGGSVVYGAIDDVDALCDRARAAGAEIPLEPTDTDYGSRDFAVRDPEGNLWSFGTYRP